MDKKELRKEILSKRSLLSAEDVKKMSTIICSNVIQEDIYAKAHNLCLYIPVRNEVDACLLIDDARMRGKRIWLPKVDGTEMDFYLYEKDTELISGAYNIPEPVSEVALKPDENTLVIMPGAVFSRKGDRIGYGGGYYDRYLEKHPACKTIALCYDFQIKEEIPTELHDIRPDQIIINSGKVY